jgi:hypothetical protein
VVNTLIEKFLDTKYDGPLIVNTFEPYNRKCINISYGDELIISGVINDSGTFMHIDWSVDYYVWRQIYRYIPLEKDIESGVITWVRKKCKSQGIPFVGPTFYNLK